MPTKAEELGLRFIPLYLRHPDGSVIDHLDFSAVRDSTLVQMIENALSHAANHCERGLLGQARTFSRSISPGFEYAEQILGIKYRETNLPLLKQTFEALKSKYQI